MRLIDADALLNNTIFNPMHVPYISKQDVLSAPTINGWISVKDRLPEKYQDVLVLVKYDGTIYCEQFHEQVIAWLTVNGDWDSDCGDFNDSDGVITHWMPIPEPPKEEKMIQIYTILPENCYLCFCMADSICRIKHRYIPVNMTTEQSKRPEWCPMKQVPEEGGKE